jgi:hypothetical protein
VIQQWKNSIGNPEDIRVEEMNMHLARFFFISSSTKSKKVYESYSSCHNDVINAGQNNRLFAPGTDMDRKRLRLSHMQKGTFYVQICDKYMLSGCELIDKLRVI